MTLFFSQLDDGDVWLSDDRETGDKHQTGGSSQTGENRAEIPRTDDNSQVVDKARTGDSRRID